MKIGYITDTHLGARGGSNVFREYFKQFYSDILFPRLKEEKVTDLLHGGDFFDNRDAITANDVDFVRNFFLPLLEKNKITMHLNLGNHDIHYKNVNEVSISSIFSDHPNVKIYSEATELDFDGYKILFVPWINSSNYDDTLKTIKASKARTCLGHFEIEGFKMYRDSIVSDGLGQKVFKHFERVLSGHYHHSSTVGNITYLGSPYHLNWQDYPDQRGFYIFDTKSDKLEFVENDYSLFVELEYSEDLDPADYEHMFVKLFVFDKPSASNYKRFIDKFKKVRTHKLDIIDKTLETSKVKQGKVKTNTDSLKTINVINAYAKEKIEDKDVVKEYVGYMEDVYSRVLKMQGAE